MDQPVLVAGSINMDLVIKVPRAPRPGENVFGDDLQAIPGGKGANQAVGVARLGCPTLLAGRVGRDPYGQTLVTNLEANRVDTSLVERDPETGTGIALIMVDQAGENSIVISTGANGHFSERSAAKLAETMSSVALVLLQLELPLDPVADIIDMARGLGKPVVLDAGPPCPQPRASFFGVNILTPNEAEAEALSGQPIKDLSSARRVARYLLSQGPTAVVLKLGEQGCLFTDRNSENYFPAYAVDVVDTTAAGDAFSAALSVAMVEGKSLEEAVEFANAAGALAVTKAGATPSLPDRDELEAFLSKR
jgi:ribokinase